MVRKGLVGRIRKQTHTQLYSAACQLHSPSLAASRKAAQVWSCPRGQGGPRFPSADMSWGTQMANFISIKSHWTYGLIHQSLPLYRQACSGCRRINLSRLVDPQGLALTPVSARVDGVGSPEVQFSRIIPLWSTNNHRPSPLTSLSSLPTVSGRALVVYFSRSDILFRPPVSTFRSARHIISYPSDGCLKVISTRPGSPVASHCSSAQL